MSDEGRLVAGRYRIIERIGTGAMGAVWKAQDEILARSVAIKQLLLQPGLEEDAAEDARRRTMREGRIAARLHHPNAITVFDVVTDENSQPCLIMEYLNSTSLAEVLQDHRTLAPPEVARIGAQVAAALKEAHAVGIVHRDIKPGNILLSGNGTVKITDFGISRAKDDVTVTKTGMIAGTPAYLAPEVAIGGEPGPESDIFSLGSTLYAACEGQPPFGLSENTLGLLHAVAAGQINPPRRSGPLASVLAVLLHPEIHHRPTAGEAEELLVAVARGETPLGGVTGETRMTPVAGVLGTDAAGAAFGVAAATGNRGYGEDEIPAMHSGTLLDQQPAVRDFYGNRPDDDYTAGTGYPEDDYDGYDTPRRGGTGSTRAVQFVTTAHHGHDDYDGYESPPEDGNERPGAWKKPAIIGGVVLIALTALIAMGVWLFSPRGPNPSPKVPPKQTASSSARVSVTPPPTTSSGATTAGNTNTRRSTEKTTQSQQPPPVTTTTRTSKSTATSPSSPTFTSSPPEPPSTSTQPPSSRQAG